MTFDVDILFNKLKNFPTHYEEEIHCKLILQKMMGEGRISAFCVSAQICEKTFYNWTNKHPLFLQCYALGKMYAREAWEKEGYELRDMITPPGTINHAFDHWRMIGWSRFGISKNSRIKLNLTPGANPDKHYVELLEQAANGDFTASEFKQLMEAINVGLNVHQIFALQKEIDQLKSDLAIMQSNTNVQNSFTNKGIAKKD